MHPFQQAAYESICLFVSKEGGDTEDTERRGNHYFWTSPNGDVAGIGWVGPEFELSAKRK